VFITSGGPNMTSLESQWDATTAVPTDSMTTLSPAEPQSQAMTYIFVLFIGVFLFAYSLGWGTVPSVVISELFPQRLRSLAGSMISFAGLTSGTVCASIFRPLSDTYGMSAVFCLYGGCGLAGVIFIIVFLPETKNRSLEELDDIMYEDQEQEQRVIV